MNLPIKLVCKTRKLRRDGTAGIALQYCLNSDRRVLLDSGLGIPPKYWNKKNDCILNSLPPAFGSADELNQKLNEEIKKARYIVLHGIPKSEDSLKFFKEFYNPSRPLQAIIDYLENSDKEKFLSDINKN